MKLFLALVVCMVLLTPVTNAEAAHEKDDPFQIKAGISKILRTVPGENIAFKSIFNGEDMYEALVAQLNRLTKKAEKGRYPLIEIPIGELPEEIWLELEAEVKNRQGLVMKLISYDRAEAGKEPEKVQLFRFHLPLE